MRTAPNCRRPGRTCFSELETSKGGSDIIDCLRRAHTAALSLELLGISHLRTDLESRSRGLARARQAAASDEDESPEARRRGYRHIDTGSRWRAKKMGARRLSGRVRWRGDTRSTTYILGRVVYVEPWGPGKVSSGDSMFSFVICPVFSAFLLAHSDPHYIVCGICNLPSEM